jgi:hypothetical protein
LSGVGRAATAAFEQLLQAVGAAGDVQTLRALRIWTGLHGLVMLLGHGLPFGAAAGDIEVYTLVSSIIGQD